MHNNILAINKTELTKYYIAAIYLQYFSKYCSNIAEYCSNIVFYFNGMRNDVLMDIEILLQYCNIS